MDDGNVGGGELHARIECGNVRVIPLRDGAGEDFSEHGASELQLRIETLDVVNGHHGAEHRGEVEDGAGRGLQLFVVHRAVGRAEEDGPVGDLLDAAAGSDRLVVDPDVR